MATKKTAKKKPEKTKKAIMQKSASTRADTVAPKHKNGKHDSARLEKQDKHEKSAKADKASRAEKHEKPAKSGKQAPEAAEERSERADRSGRGGKGERAAEKAGRGTKAAEAGESGESDAVSEAVPTTRAALIKQRHEAMKREIDQLLDADDEEDE